MVIYVIYTDNPALDCTSHKIMASFAVSYTDLTSDYYQMRSIIHVEHGDLLMFKLISDEQLQILNFNATFTNGLNRGLPLESEEEEE